MINAISTCLTNCTRVTNTRQKIEPNNKASLKTSIPLELYYEIIKNLSLKILPVFNKQIV